MKKKTILFILFSALILILSGCSASTKTEREKEEKKEKLPSEIKEDFDIEPYRAKIEVEDFNFNPEVKDLDVWYEYDDSEYNSGGFEVIDTVSGYRVQVISTDNLEEANNIRSEIYFKTNQKNVYIDFDPPVYKVKAGDFVNISEANELSFKLTQMGYAESRVIREMVNVYK